MSYTWTLSVGTAPSVPLTGAIFRDEAVPADVDFGFDIMTLPDLDASFTPRRDAYMLADAFLRRLYTRRGLIWSDPLYGFYILDYLNSEVTPGLLSEMVAGVKGQAEQDERIADIEVRAGYDSRTETLSLSLAIVSAAGPFRLVLGVTEFSTEILLEV